MSTAVSLRDKLNETLAYAVGKDASDVHIKANSPILLRIYGKIYDMDMDPLSPEEARDLAYSILSQEHIATFERDLELDLGYELAGVSRFRVNVFRQRDCVGMVLRAIPYRIRSMEELNLPPICWTFCDRPRGLVLVTGPAGCGKSTTQAAMLDYINQNYPLHIVTVEDPIEFVHEDKVGMVNQREVGADTHSFQNALKYVLREDPDVILIGEMRDLETIRLAITAAETGHLVFGTLHTPDAVQTVDRMIDVFPTFQQPQVRMQLSVNLLGVISQTLVLKKEGGGRAAAFETLSGTPAVRSLVREARTYQIASSIQTGTKQGMMSLDMSLASLVKRGMISMEEAMSRCANLNEFLTLAGETKAQ